MDWRKAVQEEFERYRKKSREEAKERKKSLPPYDKSLEYVTYSSFAGEYTVKKDDYENERIEVHPWHEVKHARWHKYEQNIELGSKKRSRKRR